MAKRRLGCIFDEYKNALAITDLDVEGFILLGNKLVVLSATNPGLEGASL